MDNRTIAASVAGEIVPVRAVINAFEAERLGKEAIHHSREDDWGAAHSGYSTCTDRVAFQAAPISI